MKKIVCVVVLLALASPAVFGQFQRVEGPTFVTNEGHLEFLLRFELSVAAAGVVTGGWRIGRVENLPRIMTDDMLSAVNLFPVRIGDVFTYGARWAGNYYYVLVRVTSASNGRATNIDWRAGRMIR